MRKIWYIRSGQITLGMILTGLSIIGSALGFSGYFNSKIEATNARVGSVEGDIKSINTKIEFLVEIAGGKFNQNTGIVEIKKQSNNKTSSTIK